MIFFDAFDYLKIANEENQVKNILIVGNGYDLACGLKSKFSDFFNPLLARYLFQLNKKAEQNELKKEVSELYNHIYDSFIKENEYKKFLNKDEELFFESDFSKLLIKTFYPHFWVFIRCIISKKVNVVVKFSLQVKFLTNLESNENDSSDTSDLDKILEKLCQVIDEVNYKDPSWFDIENVITSIVKKKMIQLQYSLKKEDNKSILEDIKTFNDALNKYEQGALYQASPSDKPGYNEQFDYDLDSCLEGLELFKTLFTEYLKKEQTRYCSANKNIKNPLNQKYDKVISLNYTNLFKQSLIETSVDNICYIHGKLEDENIVIGTESYYFSENSRDDTNISNVPFFKFFQRVLNKTDDKYLSWLSGRDYFSLTFFGFSFSQNDFDLIRELVVQDDKVIRQKIQNITIYCYKESDKYNCLVNLATCLGKKLLLSLKGKLEFKVLN